MPGIARLYGEAALGARRRENHKTRQGRAARAVPASGAFRKQDLARVRGRAQRLSQSRAAVRLLGEFGTGRGKLLAEHVERNAPPAGFLERANEAAGRL